LTLIRDLSVRETVGIGSKHVFYLSVGVNRPYKCSSVRVMHFYPASQM